MCSSRVHEQEVGSMRGMKKEIAKEPSKDERSEDLIVVTSLQHYQQIEKPIERTENKLMYDHQSPPRDQT